jgi:hypothetical protein
MGLRQLDSSGFSEFFLTRLSSYSLRIHNYWHITKTLYKNTDKTLC